MKVRDKEKAAAAGEDARYVRRPGAPKRCGKRQRSFAAVRKVRLRYNMEKRMREGVAEGGDRGADMEKRHAMAQAWKAASNEKKMRRRGRYEEQEEDI